MTKRPPRPYIDWGKPGPRYQRGGVMPFVREPPAVPQRILTLAALGQRQIGTVHTRGSDATSTASNR